MAWTRLPTRRRQALDDPCPSALTPVPHPRSRGPPLPASPFGPTGALLRPTELRLFFHGEILDRSVRQDAVKELAGLLLAIRRSSGYAGHKQVPVGGI
jgi:hypothetical protein